MLGEDAHVADGFADAVTALELGEEAAEALGGDVGLNVFGIDTAAGFGDARFTDIRAKELNVSLGSFVAEKVEERDGQRIGFFAGSAGGSPNADAGFRTAALDKGWKNRGLEGIEHLGIAEKAGDIDEHVLVKGFDFLGIGLHVSDILWTTMRR